MTQYASSRDSGLPSILAEMGIEVGPASEKFRSWFEDRYSQWELGQTFLESLPKESVLVCSQDRELFYLDDETIIYSVANRGIGSDLLPIGALMSGSMLAIDTRINNGMAVGQIPQMHAMQGDCSEMDRKSYFPYGISYAEWLRHNWEYPEDRKYR